MRIMIITVAGLSTRFHSSLTGNIKLPKCLYNNGAVEDSILYKILHKSSAIDKYIIVGGYLFDVLDETIKAQFADILDKTVLVYNDKYSEYGSGYSLYKGIQKAIEYSFDEIIFAEGDLYVDSESFGRIVETEKNVLTVCREPIWADKAVALYVNMKRQINYIYDTEHNFLEIKEPFTGILNSGQIWKFADSERVRLILEQMDTADWLGTNLVYIQKYFDGLTQKDYEIVEFDNWINCNTVDDFNKIKTLEGLR